MSIVKALEIETTTMGLMWRRVKESGGWEVSNLGFYSYYNGKVFIDQ